MANGKSSAAKLAVVKQDRHLLDAASEGSADISQSRMITAFLGLQSRLFAEIAQGEPMQATMQMLVEGVQDALESDACVVALQSGGNAPVWSTDDKLAGPVARAACDLSDDVSHELPETLGAKGFTSAWTQRVDDGEEEIGRLVVLFQQRRERNAVEALALGSLSPVIQAAAINMRQDAELDSARDRFASLEKSIPGVVYQRVVKPDGDIRYTYISEAAQDLFGVSADRIVSDPTALFSTYSEEYRENFRDRLMKASEEMKTWDVEAKIDMPDGTVKYTHAIATPKKAADGSTVWTGVIMDASRIKEVEADAAEAEARTRALIVESLNQGILLFGPDDQLALKNSQFDRVFPKLARRVRVGMTYADYLSAETGSKGITARDERQAAHDSGEALISERQLSDGTCLLVDEHRTPEGGTVVLYTDITELRRREAHIEHMAHHDALTGLPNRVLFNDRLEQALQRSERLGTTVAVLYLDLDHFKNVNDTLGHSAGDLLLKEVSRRIMGEIRACDTVSRLGGDEFAVVMTDLLSPVDARIAGDRIIEALFEPVDVNGQKALTGGSVGIAYAKSGSESSETLMKRADLALYRAKEDGRGVVRLFEAEMDEAARERRALEMDLRFAIERDELQLHFQPLISTRNAGIVGFEALVRWNHPGRGFISPEMFIPLAEETGLICKLSDWVLDRACTEAASWSKPVKIAVNLSIAQFKTRDLVDKVKEALDRSGLDPCRLELEITESVLIKRADLVHKMLYELKDLGVRIAMDDFGTGYSSLGNLRSFPFDKLKIDKSFVNNLADNPEALAIVRAVVGLGKSMGLDTVAEGVETLDQLAYLRIEGCNEVQGYYYSRAQPAASARAMLDAEDPWKDRKLGTDLT